MASEGDQGIGPASARFRFRSKQVLCERLAAGLLWVAAIFVVSVLGWILFDILFRGISQLSFSFLVAAPEDAGRAGGIGTIITSTLLILAVTLAVAAPLSLASAIALAETTRKRLLAPRAVRFCLDVLAAVPSIVFGLFGNAFFCITLGMGYSILSGGLTLACMVLPILIRTTEQAIRAVPKEYQYAAASLGLGRAATLYRIILPAAAPSMAAGLVLSIGRALAETAALIFTAGYVTRMPESMLDSGRALSVHIYDLSMNVPGGNTQAYATAAVLVALLLVINAVTATLSHFVSFHPDSRAPQ